LSGCLVSQPPTRPLRVKTCTFARASSAQDARRNVGFSSCGILALAFSSVDIEWHCWESSNVGDRGEQCRTPPNRSRPRTALIHGGRSRCGDRMEFDTQSIVSSSWPWATIFRLKKVETREATPIYASLSLLPRPLPDHFSHAARTLVS
jgi:hypothetical protein